LAQAGLTCSPYCKAIVDDRQTRLRQCVFFPGAEILDKKLLMDKSERYDLVVQL